MATYPFDQIDVFCPEPPGGNPLAVVHDADGLTEDPMVEFARWTNLSETTFLLPPTAEGRAQGADYRVRIFTPGGELPFAGHPTIGSCHAWLARGARPGGGSATVLQECGIGLVALRIEADRIAFAAPPLLRSGPVAADDAQRVAVALGLGPRDVVDAAWADNGPGWMGLLLTDAATVLALRPDFAALGDAKVGVVGPHPTGGPADVEVRAFCPGYGVPEDPVTGSLNAALAMWLIGTGRLPTTYVAAQGTALGRRGRVHVSRDEAGVVWVGGAARTVITGSVELGA
jgi:PhzF family phenazine biosynthesis protein